MEESRRIRVAIIKGLMANYSGGFYDRLFARKDLLVKVYCQESTPGMNLKAIHDKYSDNVQIVKSYSIKQDRLSWHFLPWEEILSDYDVIFIEGNPRNLSHALLATWSKICKKKVVLWTMAHSHRNNALTENLRLLWSRIFDFLLVYTDAEVEFLRRKGFKNNYIVGQNNGLDQKSIDSTILLWPQPRLQKWQTANGLDNHTLILSCARLEPKNKFNQLIEALPIIIDKVPNLLWCIIGNGVEQKNLELMIKTSGLEKNIRFVGELYDEEDQAPWFLSSEILVHPGAVGLSLLHAFGYGLPVVLHGNSHQHGPDYAAFTPELTGRNFSIDNIADLAETIIRLLRDDKERANMKKYVQEVARENFNVDIMVERFVHIAKKAITI